MTINIINIGNSKGLRLSKTIREKYGIEDKIEIVLEEDRIILKPIKNPRAGWAEAFSKMNSNNDELDIVDINEDDQILKW